MRSTRFMDRLFEPVRIVGGAHTRAIVHRAADTFNPGDQFLTPKLECRVRAESILQVGQVIELQNGGDKYLLGHHSDEIPGWRQFVMLPCDRQVSWQSTTTVIDPLTNLAKGTAPTDHGLYWVYWERQVTARQDVQLRIPDVTFLVAIGAAVQQQDTLDGKTVVRVDTALGLTVCDVRL